MDDEQRRLFRETQAVMSLLEGFSDYVMDEYGRDLVPGVERISERFHARRDQKKTGVERAVMRLIGMDMKIEQYRKGERFVAAIAASRRPGRPQALWAGPDNLPREGEIEAPERWLAPGDRLEARRLTDPNRSPDPAADRTACPRRSP